MKTQVETDVVVSRMLQRFLHSMYTHPLIINRSNHTNNCCHLYQHEVHHSQTYCLCHAGNCVGRLRQRRKRKRRFSPRIVLEPKQLFSHSWLHLCWRYGFFYWICLLQKMFRVLVIKAMFLTFSWNSLSLLMLHRRWLRHAFMHSWLHLFWR